MYSDFREEVEHMKKKIEWKDSQISELIKEKTLGTDSEHMSQQQQSRTVTFPRLSVSSAQRDSPDSTREIERVYQQFDRSVILSKDLNMFLILNVKQLSKDHIVISSLLRIIYLVCFST
jgi:hypothetical protein